MRRKPGALLPLEEAILEAGVALLRQGALDFHGFAMAKRLSEGDGARRLTAHGTLYKALNRMADAGLLASRWEDPELAMADSRPPRRLYQVTAAGEAVLAAATAGRRSTVRGPGWATT